MLSGTSVFLTGPPGAGKTYVLNEFIRRSERAGRHIAVTASTGIAATHIGGATIHSWSGLGIRDTLTPYDKEWLQANATLRKRYASIDTLVIDEISMLHGKRLDMVNEVCKLLRESDAPFGGLQLILVGDLFQLPPVNRESDLVDFAHTSAAWQELKPKVCYLSEQHRQQGDRLLDVLEAMRRGQVEDWHVATLEERIGRRPSAGTTVTRLYAHNADVDSINQRHLDAVTGRAEVFGMASHGPAAKVDQLKRSVLAPETLVLKAGAEVMFVANNFAGGYVNGSRGQVAGFRGGLPLVQLQDGGRVIAVEPYAWALTEDGKKRAEVSQLPLRLAWAITIHKSQGMSLDAAEIDLSKSFTPGMGYVALSRVRSLDGVYLTGLNAMALRLHPDIFAFDAELRAASAALAETTPDAPDEVVASPVGGSVVAGPPVNQALLTKLKMWRIRRAQADGVPPYVIAHDTLLDALAARPPATIQQLLTMPGIGPKKLETYGEELLALLREYAPAAGQATPSPATEQPWRPEEDAQLLDLLRSGMPLEQTSRALARPPEAVWAHIAELLAGQHG